MATLETGRLGLHISFDTVPSSTPCSTKAYWMNDWMNKQETLAQRTRGPSAGARGSGTHPSARLFSPSFFSSVGRWGRRASRTHDQAMFLILSMGAPAALNGRCGGDNVSDSDSFTISILLLLLLLLFQYYYSILLLLFNIIIILLFQYYSI